MEYPSGVQSAWLRGPSLDRAGGGCPLVAARLSLPVVSTDRTGALMAGSASLFDFSDHVALVVGGASGLGRAIAGGFADSGARVVVADLNQEAAVQVCQE